MNVRHALQRLPLVAAVLVAVLLPAMAMAQDEPVADRGEFRSFVPGAARSGDASPPPQDSPSAQEAPLAWARRDLAERLDADPLDITMSHFQRAGFDGCTGVSRPDVPCEELFVFGFIAFYTHGGDQYRYHFGAEIVATDFLTGEFELNDGTAYELQLEPDVSQLFATYARDDAALRRGVAYGDVYIWALDATNDTAICEDEPETPGCDDGIVDTAIVLLDTGGPAWLHHVSDDGVETELFEDDQPLPPPRPDLADFQEQLREDLAGRLDVNPDALSIVSSRIVEWPDTCFGVYPPDIACGEAITPGLLVFIEAPGGTLYRYHSAGFDEFAATDFEPEDVTIRDPIALPSSTVYGELPWSPG